MSLVDAAAALDRLIGRTLGGGGNNKLPSPHTTSINKFRSPNYQPAPYTQVEFPYAESLPHLGHSPIYQKPFQNNEQHFPTCSTPLESLAPPLPPSPFSQHWGYPLEHPQDVHQTVSMAAGSSILSPTQVPILAAPLAATISPSQVSGPAVFPVSDKHGSPLQHFKGLNQISSTEVKGSIKLPHGICERVESDEFVPLDPEKYKTELCRSFQVHGSCKYSFRCNYAHGLGQLRSPSRHGKYKTRNCQSYHRTGFCRYGARCSFIHDPEEGVLRCSIANKEVLEALHYHPEDETRIANITWRLDEDPLMNQPATLHFIKSHTPLDENLDNSSVFLKPRESCTGNMLPLTWTQPIEKSDLNCSTTESIEVFRDLYSNLNSRNDDNPSFPFSKNIMSKEMQNNEDFVLNSIRLLDELADVHPVLEGCQHSQTVKIEEVNDGFTPPKFLDTMEESHSLQCLEVVNDILKNAPNYSSSVWSVAADDINSLATESQLKEVINEIDLNHNELAIYTKSKEECFNKITLGNEVLFDDSTYALACSTLRSEYDESIDKNNSRKSSGDLNLADLIESLRVHEERQLVRCPMSCHSQESLVLSPDSQMSPDEDTRLFDLTKYKTELCRSFQYNGFCKYGDACLYAHGGVDLRMYPKHPMYRTKKCFSFHNKGYCLYGSRCQFLHDVE